MHGHLVFSNLQLKKGITNMAYKQNKIKKWWE